MTPETIELWLGNAQKTQEFGASLANTLYPLPLTILLDGEVGSGKTTFLQGFAKALGMEEDLTSPTFALEQRYLTTPGMEFRHLDLYRLSETEARQLLLSTEEFEGIRCIEWANKVPSDYWSSPVIRIHLSEEREGRKAVVTFDDLKLPTDAEIAQWRDEAMLPPHIVSHCEMVAKACDQLSALLLAKGVAVRPHALRRAGQLHDLLRFLDFHSGGSRGEEYTPEQLVRWEEWRQRYPLRHEEAATAFLKDQGYDGIAEIIFTHGFLSPRKPKTIEQKLLYYADKRSTNDQLVTLDERFHDFLVRYGDGKNPSPEFVQWKKETRAVEQEVFPEGEPVLD